MKSLYFVLLFFATNTVTFAATWDSNDLSPVTMKEKPSHAPVVLVKDGKAVASIVVMNRAAGASDLQTYIKLATGAELPIVNDKIVSPAVVLGDCAEAATLGLNSKNMPVEGFGIKTTSSHVFIVGNRYGRGADGQLWGVNDFLQCPDFSQRCPGGTPSRILGSSDSIGARAGHAETSLGRGIPSVLRARYRRSCFRGNPMGKKGELLRE